MASLLGIGAAFLIIGLSLRAVDSDEIHQRKVQYDGSGTSDSRADCHISRANEGRVCEIRIKALHQLKAPAYVYYEIENFHQNHERYVVSLNAEQLLGANLGKGELNSCSPLKESGSKILSPCGVIANSMFNDVITLTNPGLTMRENKIAWASDKEKKFKQPKGFHWAFTPDNISFCENSVCPDAICDQVDIHRGCKGYVCKGGDFDAEKCDAGQHTVFYYRHAEQYQFLYETFPMVVSPLVGVKNEHFAVWMRLAALSTFRKLYGRITDNVSEDEELVFRIENNFNVGSFNGKKRLVVTTAATIGEKPKFLWLAFLSISATCVGLAIMFFLKNVIAPRKRGDTDLLHTD